MRNTILSDIDVNKIITGTPSKLLHAEYEKLKANYNDSAAMEYAEVYKKLPFHDILENLVYILREPRNGLIFFNDLIDNYMMCAFTHFDIIKDTLDDFIENNIDKMPSSQKDKYISVQKNFNRLYDESKGTRVYAQYISETISDKFETTLSDAMYKSFIGEDTYEIDNLFNTDLSYKIIITYIPYVINFLQTETGILCIDKISNICAVNKHFTPTEFKQYMSAIMCLNRVGSDEAYREALNIANILTNYKNILRVLIAVDVNDELDKYATIEVQEEYHYQNKELSVLSVLDDIVDNSTYIEGTEITDEKKEIIDVFELVYDEAAEVMTTEFMMYDGLENSAKGYTIEKIADDTSFDDLYHVVLERNVANRKLYYDQWNDKTGDNAGPENNGKDHQEPDADAKEDTQKGDRPIRPSSGDPSKKPKEDLVTKVHVGAMDLEQKQLALLAGVGRGLDALRQAGKAVLTIPNNFIKFAKDIGKGVDNWDDERRKKEMLKPGYRKHVFATLHALIQYGIAWNINILLMPIVFFIRKLSAEKNVRIRNEVERNLTTEIKICSERIDDAQAEGKKQEKYKLIRIKEELEAELLRVKTNSKNV